MHPNNYDIVSKHILLQLIVYIISIVTRKINSIEDCKYTFVTHTERISV